MWKKDPNGTAEDHWIDLIYQDEIDEEDEHWWHASVKWDGCIHLYFAGQEPFSKNHGFHNDNRPENLDDTYIHICELDNHIERLMALRDAAKKHFVNREAWNNNNPLEGEFEVVKEPKLGENKADYS